MWCPKLGRALRESAFDHLAADLQERRAQHLYRVRKMLDSAQGPEIICDGKPYICFCSNDYLGLAQHPAIISAAKKAMDDYGFGSGASHLVIGHSRVHHELEEALADFTGRSRALLFSTGYMANMGAIRGLLGQNDVVIEDQLNHASLLDGGWLSRARFSRYQHASAAGLAAHLEGVDTQTSRTLVVTDGVFSMDGYLAPLSDLAELTQAQGAWLMVDDAHGFGVLGRQGRGAVDHFGLTQNDVPVLVGTFGKAFGTAGAFVAGSEMLIESLIQHARSYIYTTAMPPAVAAATRAALSVLESDEWRRDRMAQLIRQFRAGANALGLSVLPSETPIQPLMVGDAMKSLAISQALADEGLLIGAIRPPTVPKGTARLRITLSATHTETHVNRLLDALDKARKVFDLGS